MTIGFLASFGAVALVFAGLLTAEYLLLRAPERSRTDLSESLARAEAAAREVERELARLRQELAVR